MLNTLRIRNLALVDEADIEFRRGLNVITGETGAGKSLLIGALKLLLGERADRSMIRTGETRASAEAVFQLDDPSAVDALLEDRGLAPCEDGRLIIRRVIRDSGSGQNTVNDGAVTLQVLKSIGDLLVDMHGPHDHQSLLRPEIQREVLDAFGRLDEPLRACREAFRAWRQAKDEREELERRASGDPSQRIDFLSYQLEEVEQANLSEEDEARVREEHTMLANAQEVLQHARTACQALTEGEPCAFDALAAAQRELNALARLVPEAESSRAELEEISARVQELSRAVADRAGGMEAGPERMQWLEERLATYQSLQRKHRADVPALLEMAGQWREELAALERIDEERAEIDRRIEERYSTMMRRGVELHRQRAEAADRLSESITRELAGLGFPHGFFDVAVHESEPGPYGTDTVEFGFAPNPGEEMRPMSAIASSGEISRVMLAVKTVLARHDLIPLLVFDEIDANVGGELAHAVGDRLARVAATHQVLCITHLAQVAACGTTHLAVRKTVRDGRTYTAVAPLDEQARVDEITRMMGGAERSAAAGRHAAELLESARDASR
ncbi:DNA repair protein RecN [Kiritimatiella glycovorans]|uniref:DNA repair protein RecN n=1 Tax=Kiritimatiella glycovorans TaxID=1307763 RepID=A0A0G3ELB5_9BACT|nr:DNA repair protein RecN [Kiritimatiella glycovorans]AKJ65560.1 Recombination protein N [Kiritimatiella glycovorans]